MNCFGQSFIDDRLFFQKFNNINCLIIDKRDINKDHLTKLLINCHKLRNLHICIGILDRNFFDHLPSITSLFALEIDGNYKNIKKFKLDVEFLNKITYLSYFYTRLNIINYKKWNAQKFTLNKLEYFKFHLNDLPISIQSCSFFRYFKVNIKGADLKINKFEEILRLLD